MFAYKCSVFYTLTSNMPIGTFEMDFYPIFKYNKRIMAMVDNYLQSLKINNYLQALKITTLINLTLKFSIIVIFNMINKEKTDKKDTP